MTTRLLLLIVALLPPVVASAEDYRIASDGGACVTEADYYTMLLYAAADRMADVLKMIADDRCHAALIGWRATMMTRGRNLSRVWIHHPDGSKRLLWIANGELQ